MARNKLKGQIWVSAVLYLLIGSIIIILILEAGLPIIKKNRDRAVFSQTRDQFIGMDNAINDVIEESVGSQRVIPFEVPEGKVTLKDNVLQWEMESEAKIIEPRTHIDIGNVKVVTDVDVDAYEHPDHFTMENSFLRVNISRIGSADAPAAINTANIIESFYSIESDKDLMIDGDFSFVLDDKPETAIGTGYTELVPSGNSSNIDFAKVLVHIDSNTNNNYTLSFLLDSKADYLKIDVIDYE